MTREELQQERQKLQGRMQEIDGMLDRLAKLETMIQYLRQQLIEGRLPVPLSYARKGAQQSVVALLVDELRAQQETLLNPPVPEPEKEESPRQCAYCKRRLVSEVPNDTYCRNLCVCGHQCQDHDGGRSTSCAECDCVSFRHPT